MKKKEGKKAFIRRVVKEVGYTLLSSRCGKYLSMMTLNDGKHVVAKYDDNGCTLHRFVDEISNRDISRIYEDLRMDFE